MMSGGSPASRRRVIREKSFFAGIEPEAEEDEELIKASNAAFDLVEAGRF
jgi:hypothetical protein